MEAIEFLKEYKRMCIVSKKCYRCPLMGTTCTIDSGLSEEQMIDIIEKTEQWSKEHHIVTNEMKFCEIFGDNAVNSVLAVHQSDIKTWFAQPYKEQTK